MNKRVDVAISQLTKWQAETKALRKIALETGLTEELKWGQPCYTLDGKNVFLIHSFKNYFAILFMKGVLMKDPKKILVQATENVQSARQIRFTTLAEVKSSAAVIKKYLNEAIAVEESGVQVPMKKAADFEIPAEIVKILKKSTGLLPAFKKLTPGRQRAYILHFTSAKQEATRISRIEKVTPKILAGKGLND
ncbi:MAG: DUF1801 domain-containing protein [Actinomycetes bacterium]